MSQRPLISVVTPVYNTELYLAECIESVLSQTYRPLEYIIVDNCSTDRSLEIAESYARGSDIIRVLRNDRHLGVLQNWNHAMRQISPDSRYCKVVHADDWLFPECIGRMAELAEAHPAVGIVGSYRLEETKVGCDGLPYPSTVVPGRELCSSRLRGGSYVFGSPTSLLIRSDLIRARRCFYNEENLHADNEACYDLLRESDFGFVHQVLTFTRRHNEAVSSYAKRMNTYILAELLILKKYGPLYLGEDEYRRIFGKRVKAYYRFLGRSVFQRKGAEFWNFHRTGLKGLGVEISVPQLGAAAAAALFSHALETVKERI